jgi:CRP-like cAMP-binding protein
MAKDSRLTKRQLKKLAKEQTGIVKKDPNNLVAKLKLAGTLKDLGKDKEAVSHYREVAKVYASTGKLIQAISVYKGILEIDPGHQKSEAALSALSAKRAKEIRAKSMPRAQQQDDGRWVMPTESDVSEEEGTDPGSSPGKVVTTSPSVLRLPAPMPTEEAASRRRRGRRSRPRLEDALPEDRSTSSTPSFEGIDPEPLPPAPADGVPSQPEGFDPSLPSLTDLGSVQPPTAPTVEPSVHVPPDHVHMPSELSSTAVPPLPPPPISEERSDTLDDDGGVTAERDLSAVAAATVSYPDLVGDAHPFPGNDIVLTAEAPKSTDRGKHSFLPEDKEEPTSPGPTGYKATIRKSAASLDMDSLLPARKPRSPHPNSPMRQTLVGVPTPEALQVSQSPVLPPLDNKKTIQMEREPDMPAPAAPSATETAETPPEPHPLDETSDETLSSVFDDEEEAIWSEFGDKDAGDPKTETETQAETEKASPLKPTPAPKPTLLTTPVNPPKAHETPPPKAPPGAGRPSKGKRPRKSSKMTIPMGAAAFKKAVADQDTRSNGSKDVQLVQSEDEVKLEEIALFRDLSETSREMLQSRLVRRNEKRGVNIVREGDPGNALFVVSSGRVRVTKQNRKGVKVSLATLGPGSFFGEFALLSDRKRHATVSVIEDGVFFEISRKVIADLTQSDPSFGNTLRQFYRRRLLGTLIRSAPFFEPLSDSEREALMGRLRFRRIPEKTKIITEGEPGGGFFLILIGEVEVTKPQPDGSPKVLSKLTDGSYFGEMSLLKGGNAVATVTTVTPTEIVQLAAAEFYRILSKYPQIWEEVNREAKRRELANLQILSGRAPDPTADDDSVVM